MRGAAVTLRHELIGLSGVLERNAYLVKRYAWWELAFFVWSLANTLTIVFIAKGVEAAGGKIDVDREHPENSSVTAQIDMRSIDTHIRKRDDHLRSPEFFNVGKFPQITFRSGSVKRTGPQSGDILGDLTMHGVTRPITLHVKLLTPINETSRTRWAVTTEPISRRDFNLMFASGAEAVSGISQTVAINIEIEAKRAQ